MTASFFSLVTRFDSTPMFKSIVPLLDALRKKKEELTKDAAKTAPNSVDNEKQRIITALLVSIDSKITFFNKQAIPADEEQNKKECVRLVVQIQAAIFKIVKSELNRKILLMPRNSNQEHFDNLVFMGSYAGTYFAAAALGFTTGGAAVTAFIFAPVVADVTCKATGANNLGKHQSVLFDGLPSLRVPASVRIILELYHHLILIGREYYQNYVEHPECSPEFFCPITHKIMIDPVICTLDERTYERKAIKAYLDEHVEVPDGTRLTDGKLSETVLIPNKSIKSMIDAYHNKEFQVTLLKPNN